MHDEGCLLAAGTGAACTSVKFGCRSSSSFHPHSVSCQCLLRSDLLLLTVEVESLFDACRTILRRGCLASERASASRAAEGTPFSKQNSKSSTSNARAPEDKTKASSSKPKAKSPIT
jgi:hypothetical protein